MEKILITGGSGFLGRNLAIRLKGKYEVYLASRNNKNNMLASNITGCKSLPMDVSNINSVRDVISEIKPDIIIHAAATKFVDISEKYPMETIDINVMGSQNVARVAIENNVKIVIGISTDKACPPIRNIYGLSKATMERMLILMDGKHETKFTAVRYGNVAWSTGSVLPIWNEMHLKTNKLGTTGPEMRRFFFTIDHAVDLVIKAIDNIEITRGKILSREMKSAQISDILNVWIEEYGGTWEKIEGRPGERLDEFLVGETELEYCQKIKMGDINYFLIDPNKKVEIPFNDIVTSMNSERLTKEEILEIIKSGKDI